MEEKSSDDIGHGAKLLALAFAIVPLITWALPRIGWAGLGFWCAWPVVGQDLQVGHA